jgi:hypothetical protein
MAEYVGSSDGIFLLKNQIRRQNASNGPPNLHRRMTRPSNIIPHDELTKLTEEERANLNRAPKAFMYAAQTEQSCEIPHELQTPIPEETHTPNLRKKQIRVPQKPQMRTQDGDQIPNPPKAQTSGSYISALIPHNSEAKGVQFQVPTPTPTIRSPSPPPLPPGAESFSDDEDDLPLSRHTKNASLRRLKKLKMTGYLQITGPGQYPMDIINEGSEQATQKYAETNAKAQQSTADNRRKRSRSSDSDANKKHSDDKHDKFAEWRGREYPKRDHGGKSTEPHPVSSREEGNSYPQDEEAKSTVKLDKKLLSILKPEKARSYTYPVAVVCYFVVIIPD